jgi:hypothetical protein
MSDEYTIAEWETSPYTSYDKRGIVVRHRVRIVRYGETGTDVIHQRREGDEDWKPVEAVEIRDHGMRAHTYRDGVMSE